MIKKKKILLYVVAFAIMFLVLPAVKTEAATTFDAATITYLDNADEFDAKAVISYETRLQQTESGASTYAYAKFTLEDSCYVRLNSIYETSASYDTGYKEISVYSNEAMTNQVIHTDVKKEGSNATALMNKGTYYMKVSIKRQSFDMDVNIKILIAAIPSTKLLSVEQSLNSNNTEVEISVTEGFGSELRTIQYQKGNISVNDNDDVDVWKALINKDYETSHDSNAIVLEAGIKTFSVKKNGIYTIRIDNNWAYNYSSYTMTFEVKGIDDKAPVISKIKNGKTYKTAVTINFEDADSGIKKATLNGKIIKSGKLVSKSGAYTLVVTDNAGNKKTIKFKINIG